jgi:ElaB/YqjD/DUF883 family membrane-anchored ribosome-binding protein
LEHDTVNAMRSSPVNRLEEASHWRGSSVPASRAGETRPWSESLRSWEESFETYLTEHPRLMIAVAAAAGLVLGWLVKRK